jgi:uncharacterized protein YdcH (DUF465 family)
MKPGRDDLRNRHFGECRRKLPSGRGTLGRRPRSIPVNNHPEGLAMCSVAGLFLLRERRSVMFEAHPQAEIEALLKGDNEFRQLYQRHKELDKQVLDAELGVLPLDDATLARMKKEKLFAKDRLTKLYDQHNELH